MSATRRAATLALLAAAAGLPAARAFAQDVVAEGPLERPDEEHPPTQLAARHDKNEHLLAPVTINDQGPFNFLLDTGANISCVSHRLMERLALTASETALVHTVVGARERPMVTLDRLQVGPRDRRRVRAPALPLKGPEIDGILGVDWLKGQRLVLDLKHSRLEITRSQPDRPEPGRVVIVPARRRKGQLTIVDADLSGERISAIIDSGAQGSLCNRRLRALAFSQEARRGEPRVPQYVQMESLAGEGFTGEVVFLPFLRLGGLHLGNVPVTCADMHVFDIWGLRESPALVIGMDLLSQFDQVALDFGRSQVRFDFI